ncbi:BRCA1-associated RING domain protein 1 isoform X2 [Halyomorpha halys]|uniref:BRCA1-associated RING domain protein 1 isoform X2 n=1 Tax=Halyomorpha halys TaxID=286706 RepID=UPI0006D52496
MESFLTELDRKIGTEKIVELLKRNENNFLCAKCGQVPQRSFISGDCEHSFCESCVNKKPFFKQCPKCHNIIREEFIINDEPYTVFSKCYEHYKSVLLRLAESDSKNTRISKKNNDFLLQDECRKLFKNRNGSLDNIRRLLSSGANPNVLNKDGWTLMHEAVDYENLEVLEILLEAGGNVNAYSGDNCTTCLHDALNEVNISTDIIKCLLNYGADINARDPYGGTPIQKVAVNELLLDLFQKHTKIYDIPTRPIPIRVPLLYACNLSLTSNKNLSTFCHTFKLKLAAPGKKISKNVTHIIVEEELCEPFHEVLVGILYGCYIVKYLWIEKSIEAGYLLPAEDYEITGTKNYPHSNASRKSRLNAETLVMKHETKRLEKRRKRLNDLKLFSMIL